MSVSKRFYQLGALSLAVGMLTACADQDIPYVSGNTFDKYNRLDITYPEATTLNISYEYIYDAEENLQLPGQESGDAWLFKEFDTATPERFAWIHQYPKAFEDGADLDGLAVVDENANEVGAVAEILNLGRRSYKSYAICVDISKEQATTEGINVMTYISAVQEAGHALSDNIFVRRYIANKEELDGQQVDLIYIQDVTRFGYDCQTLGNVFSPSEEMLPVIDELNNNANRSVEVMG